MKHRKNFYLDDSTIAYVEKFQDENNLSTFTAALAEIIQEHQHRNDVQASRVFVEELAKQVAQELNPVLTRIRLGTNGADRNSDIILLMLNTLMSYQQYSTFVPNDTPQLAQAKALEKERIAAFRQKKLDEKKRKAEKERSDKLPEPDELIIPEDDLL